MSLIVMDLEWNQSSSGKEPEVAVLPFEIIEIGAIKLGDQLQMIGEFSRLVKPQVYHGLHSYTSELIHLQMKQLLKGDPFPEVAQQFYEWCSREDLLCTWGPGDVTELQRNLMFYELDPVRKGPVAYLDVQKLFTLKYEADRKIRRNLEYAVDFLQIPKDIPFHRAFSDAYYTAGVLRRILEDDPSLMEFLSYDVTVPPRCVEEEVHTRFRNYEKYISRVFETREKALEDKEVSVLRCFECGRKLHPLIRWFTTNNKHYYAAAYCEKHGNVKSKIRLHKSADGGTYVIKTTKLIPPEDLREIVRKENKIRFRRPR